MIHQPPINYTLRQDEVRAYSRCTLAPTPCEPNMASLGRGRRPPQPVAATQPSHAQVALAASSASASSSSRGKYPPTQRDRQSVPTRAQLQSSRDSVVVAAVPPAGQKPVVRRSSLSKLVGSADNIEEATIEDADNEIGRSNRGMGTTINPDAILNESKEGDPSKIYEVVVHGGKLERIANLEKFVRLRSLDLSCNYIERIEGLETATELKELKLYSNKLTALGGLDRCKELEVMLVHHNALESLAGLPQLKKLKTLRADCNKLATTAYLPPSVTHLDLSRNCITKLEGFNQLLNLEELRITHNSVSSLENLLACTRLLELDLSFNPLQNIAALKQLRKLTILRLESVGLQSIDALPKLDVLCELHVPGNSLRRIGAAAKLYPRLELLDASRNQLDSADDIARLSVLDTLADLSVDANPVNDDARFRGEVVSRLPHVLIINNRSVRRSPFAIDNSDGRSSRNGASSSMSENRPVTRQELDADGDDYVDGSGESRPASALSRSHSSASMRTTSSLAGGAKPPPIRPQSAMRHRASNTARVEEQIRQLEFDVASFADAVSAQFDDLRRRVLQTFDTGKDMNVVDSVDNSSSEANDASALSTASGNVGVRSTGRKSAKQAPAGASPQPLAASQDVDGGVPAGAVDGEVPVDGTGRLKKSGTSRTRGARQS